MSRSRDVKNMVLAAGLEPVRMYQKHSSIHVETRAPNGQTHEFFVLTKQGAGRDDADFLARMKRFARSNPAPLPCPDETTKEKEVSEPKTITVRKRTPIETFHAPAAADLTTKEVIRLSSWLMGAALADVPSLEALAADATKHIGQPVSADVMRDVMDANDIAEPEHWHPLPDAQTIVLKELMTMFDQLGYKPSRTFERLMETLAA